MLKESISEQLVIRDWLLFYAILWKDAIMRRHVVFLMLIIHNLGFATCWCEF